MAAFLEDFYTSVGYLLSDPATSRRLTKAQKYAELKTVEAEMWNELLRVSGSHTTIGKTEATITLVDGTDRYLLPGNFRKFLSMEHRVDGDPDEVDMELGTIDTLTPGPGIEIISQEQGILIRPGVDASIAGDWTLVYQRGPVPLWYASVTGGAAGINTTTKLIEVGAPATDCGTQIKIPDFYNGCMFRIVDATTGSFQINEVVDWKIDTSKWYIQYRHAFAVAPTGATITIEICPIVPWELQEIYAMDVAMQHLGHRDRSRAQGSLRDRRRKTWNAIKQHFGVTTVDRGQDRVVHMRQTIPDPYGQ